MARPLLPRSREGGGPTVRVRGSDPVDRRLIPFLLLGLLLAGGVAGAAPTTGIGPSPEALGLALTATPTNGSAPLVVAFLASLTPNTTVGSFNWSFGDGTWYNQSATGHSNPVHAYDSVGVYGAHVSVNASSGSANASVTIDVVAENLVAVIDASPLSGPAPLTVHFVAAISGGTGTYESILWAFGDGDSGSGPDLNYTYPIDGTFQVNLTVTDSSGHAVRNQTTVTVTGGVPTGPAQPTPDPLVAALPYLLTAAAILGASAMASLAYRAAVRRRAGAIEAPPGAMVGPTPPRGPIGPSLDGSGAAGGPAPAEPGVVSGPGAALDESRRLSERILIHLLWYGRSGDRRERPGGGEPAGDGAGAQLGPEHHQQGAEPRSMDAGAVRVELSHVPGAPRRVKTYSLTPRGEAVRPLPHPRALGRQRPPRSFRLTAPLTGVGPLPGEGRTRRAGRGRPCRPIRPAPGQGAPPGG